MRTLIAATLIIATSSCAWSGDAPLSSHIPLIPPIPSIPSTVPTSEKNADTSGISAQAFLGIGMEEVDDAVMYHLKLDNDLGIMVTEVAPGTAAETMGLKVYDVIIAADGKPIYTPRALADLVRAKKPGDALAISVRRGPDTVVLNGVLREHPAQSPQELRKLRKHPDDHGGTMPKGGRIQKPDGSVMEWSVEDDDVGKSDKHSM